MLQKYSTSGLAVPPVVHWHWGSVTGKVMPSLRWPGVCGRAVDVGEGHEG